MSETIEKIIKNSLNIEKSVVNQLELETPNHHLTTGTYREAVWKSMLESVLPKKFCIDQGVFIIDSYGQISAEVDLIIYDETYTPYIFNYGKIKFIPIEAVAVVIQCKGKNPDLSNLKDWLASIQKLKTSLDSIARVISGVVDNSLHKAYEALLEYEAEQKKNPDTKKQRPQFKSQTSTRPLTILCSTESKSISQSITNMFDIS